MIGKTIKVVEYNLTYGINDRLVNVFGLFRYKPNNNLYVIYSDVDIKYNIIYYGSSHIKNNSILSMPCKEKKEEDIIKEYIFKLTNNEQLDKFESIPLDSIDGIEIISSNKIEIKPEILYQLVDLTIPKKEVVEDSKEEVKSSKKSSKKPLIFLLIILIIGISTYFFISTLTKNKDTTTKEIICKTTYNQRTLNAQVEEEIIYAFNNQEKLEKLNITRKYQFTKEDYQNFIKNGTFYRYMPDEDTEGGWDKNDNEYWFKVITKEKIDTSYSKPTNYEDVLLDAKKEGYTCDEKIN